MSTPHYGIIGNGRMAKHFAHYLSLLNLPHQRWHRGQTNESLNNLVNACEPILLLINDDAIVPFIEQHAFLNQNLLVHFSGKLYTPLAYGAHPLSTFSDPLYSLNVYQKIPFICDQDSLSFETLLPGLPNPHFKIPVHLKSFYHALCVLSGNFTTLLWQKFFAELEGTFEIPKEQAYPYLEHIMKNLLTEPDNALTGPFIRQDSQTIANHLNSLENDPFQEVYQAFLNAFQATQTQKNL